MITWKNFASSRECAERQASDRGSSAALACIATAAGRNHLAVAFVSARPTLRVCRRKQPGAAQRLRTEVDGSKVSILLPVALCALFLALPDLPPGHVSYLFT